MIHELDLIGLTCPLTTVRLKRFLKKVPAGDTIRVKATDPDARVDFPALIKTSKHDFVSLIEENGVQTYEILKKS